MKKLITGLALAAVSLMAQAQNLVVNPGFENTSNNGLTGWTKSTLSAADASQEDFRGVTNLGISGGNYFYSNGTTIPTSLSQDINTVAGTYYDLSFQLRGLTTEPDEPTVNYSNVVFGNFSQNQNSFDNGFFTTFTYKHLLASTASTLLSFTASSDNSFVHLDNVSVQISAVPEPETYAMMLLGLGLICYAMQRRRKA